MGDNEIVKAWIVVLENKRMPTEHLINVTIDRINSLTAEIERLKDKIKKAKDKVIETIPLVEEDIKTAKSEAYREFAELLFKKAERKNHKTEEYHYVLADDIVDLLKELVGEDDG